MTLTKDDRVFLADKRLYGTISRTGVLGFKGSYVVVDDDGKQLVYTGKIAQNHVVCAKECKNNCGESYELPMDIKSIGTPILIKNNVSKLVQMKIHVNFMKLSDEEKEEMKKKWIACGSSSAKKFKLMMLFA